MIININKYNYYYYFYLIIKLINNIYKQIINTWTMKKKKILLK